jgi:hypothetical protein
MSRSNLELIYAKKIQYNPDKPEKPKGPTNGKTNENYSYKATGFDFDGDKIKYGLDWGDEGEIEWTDFYESGYTIEIQHSWSEKATFKIRVKIVDIYGYESCWSDPIVVSITKLKNHMNILELILQRFNSRFSNLY